MEKRIKKKFSWCDTTVEILIDVWQHFITDLRRAKRNSHIYKAMEKKMEELDVFCDSSEISNKIKNLTQRYRNEKKLIGPSGGTPSSWKWFEKVNSILGRLPINNFELIEESVECLLNTDQEYDEYDEVEYLNSSSTSCTNDTEMINTPSTSSTTNEINSAKRQKTKMVTIHQDMLVEMQKINRIEEDRNKREEKYFELSSQFMKDSLEKQEKANTIAEKSLLLAQENLKLQKILINSLIK